MTYLAVDMGITNTRVWLVRDNRVVGRAHEPVGVRSTSISGDSSLLHRTLRNAIRSLEKKAHCTPQCVLAAGMITSAEGLYELPHVVAPAGKDLLSKHIKMKVFDDICEYPFFFVPGVRTGPCPTCLGGLDRTDVMRGEETEIIGLLTMKKLKEEWLFLHLGSHTKAIRIDKQGRIVASVSTLSGECADVLRTRTILSSSLGRPAGAKLSEHFFHSGVLHGCRNGLLRALFAVRLLSENSHYSRTDIYSFFLGSLIASDFQAIRQSQVLKGRVSHILLSGHSQLQKAWSMVLGHKSYHLRMLSPRERETAFLEGLRAVAFSNSLVGARMGGRCI